MMDTNRQYLGIALICGSYLMYSIHYATMKLVSASYPVLELLFIRSAIMVAVTVFWRPSAVREVVKSPHKWSTVLRGGLHVTATACYFLAAVSLPLGEVATLYATAPLVAVVLSAIILGERVRGLQWAAVLIGLVGAVVAANPTGAISLGPILLGLAAGLLWGVTIVFTRKSGSRESTSAQLIISGLVFCVVCGFLTEWKMPASYTDVMLIAVLGIQILFAQMLFFEGYRYAPASILAPLEYQVVVWSCLLGLLFFAEAPTLNVLIGGALIIVAGIALTAKLQGADSQIPRRRRFAWMSRIQ
ncbi:DMT family transporter [Rhizobium leguminosarum]|uniref:DMT family transporter n=1 Tax=Rhizobium leguminosarum TaxID=384 RepID=UPI003F946CA9